MAQAKVAALIFLRDLIKSKGENVADEFFKRLTSEEKDTFMNLMPINKLPIEQITKYYEKAIPVIFPEKPLSEGLRQFGYWNAQNDMKGLYKFMLRVLSLETIIKQAATIWKVYHDKGQASVQKLTPKQYTFIVENYPEIPKNFLEVNNGYITGLISLTGAKYVDVMRNDSNPNAWKWVINIG